ncbi:MAG: tetratricopeptide repeat protein [Pseudomonadota bacterium]
MRNWVLLKSFLLATALHAAPEDIDACLAYDVSYAELVEICSRAVQEPVSDAENLSTLYDYLGYAQYQEDLDDLAEENFRKSISLWPENHDALTDLGWLLHHYDRYEEALEKFKSAYSLDQTPSVLAGLGSTISHLGIDSNRAIGLLDAAFLADPEYIWAIRERGWAYFRDSRYDEAVRTFEEAERLFPDDHLTQLGLGISLSSAGDLGRSKTILEGVYETEPDNLRALVELSYLEREIGNPEVAVNYAKHAYSLDRSYDNAITQFAWSLVELDQLDQAQKIFLEGFNSQPGNEYLAEHVLDFFVFDIMDYENASKVLDETRANGVLSLHLAANGSYALLQRERNQDVIDLAIEATGAFGSDETVLFNQAYAHMALHQSESAFEALKAALQVGLPEADKLQFAKDAFDRFKFRLALRAVAL